MSHFPFLNVRILASEINEDVFIKRRVLKNFTRIVGQCFEQ